MIVEESEIMERFEIFAENPDQRIIEEAVERINKGGLIVYPTDTVYGIGCSIHQKNAIEILYRLKGKSKFEPMSLICSSIQQASEFAKISNATFRILKKCFPGPFTIVLEAKNGFAKLMLTRQKEIGIRIPDNYICQTLVSALGQPLLNSSVPINENDGLYENIEIAEEFSEQADLMLDVGPILDTGESSVIKIKENEIEILREGKGDINQIFS